MFHKLIIPFRKEQLVIFKTYTSKGLATTFKYTYNTTKPQCFWYLWQFQADDKFCISLTGAILTQAAAVLFGFVWRIKWLFN